MIELVRERGARPFLLTLPSILSSQISDEAMGRAQLPYYTNSIADMIALSEQYNVVIRRVAAETNTPLVDLAAEFDKMPDKEKFFSDTIHMYNRAKPMLASVIKDMGLKVQAQIQGDQLRVSGKVKDQLQAAMQMLKQEDFGIDMQFVNYR